MEKWFNVKLPEKKVDGYSYTKRSFSKSVIREIMQNDYNVNQSITIIIVVIVIIMLI